MFWNTDIDFTDVPHLDLLAIAAHPDDVEQTCGGTMIRMAELGYKTDMMFYSSGGIQPWDWGVQNGFGDTARFANRDHGTFAIDFVFIVFQDVDQHRNLFGTYLKQTHASQTM